LLGLYLSIELIAELELNIEYIPAAVNPAAGT